MLFIAVPKLLTWHLVLVSFTTRQSGLASSLTTMGLLKFLSFNGTELQKMWFSFYCTVQWMRLSSRQLQEGI